MTGGVLYSGLMTELLRAAAVKDFQSVSQSKIELGVRSSGGGLTLIVGPSSTGKSAVLRALRLLAYNGASVPVRDGAKTTKVAAVFDSGMKVGVERGKALSTYTLGTDTYSKAGTSVPKDVEKFLGLYGGAHFAFQFDLPYLLAEPGAAVTKVLGEVTNAHVLTEAVREGSRRKMQASQLARTRRGDAETASKALEGFESLPIRQKALEAAREALEAADEAEAEALTILETATRLARLREELEGLTVPEVPDISGLLEKARKALEYAALLDEAVATHEKSTKEKSTLEQEAAAVEQEQEEIELARVQLLRTMGRCPTCGTDTHDFQGK